MLEIKVSEAISAVIKRYDIVFKSMPDNVSTGTIKQEEDNRNQRIVDIVYQPKRRVNPAFLVKKCKTCV